MDSIKDLFNERALTYEEFIKKAKEQSYNIVDLSKGGYVSKGKFDRLAHQRDILIGKHKTLNDHVFGDNGLEKRIEKLNMELKAKDIALKELKEISANLAKLNDNKNNSSNNAEQIPYVISECALRKRKRVLIRYPDEMEKQKHYYVLRKNK